MIVTEILRTSKETLVVAKRGKVTFFLSYDTEDVQDLAAGDILENDNPILRKAKQTHFEEE